MFFELLNGKEINEEIIERQQKEDLKKEALPQKYGCVIPLLAVISLVILIFYHL